MSTTVRKIQEWVLDRLLCSMSKTSELVSHAERELAGPLGEGEDSVNRWAADDAVRLIRAFSIQGHSGMSAAWARNIFGLLADLKPIGPLTGEDDEWNEVGEGVYQNRRCSHVFKDEDEAYDSEGRIFRESDGGCYTNIESRVPVMFPYVPRREYVDVSADA